MRFFFYGTLLDRDVAALVLGRRLPPGAFVPAVLPGHARWQVKGGTYPIAVRDPCREVEGAVVSGLSARDVARLAAYEGPGYRISLLKVRVAGSLIAASMFEPLMTRLQPTRRLWHLAVWQRRDKRLYIARIRRSISAHPAYSTQ